MNGIDRPIVGAIRSSPQWALGLAILIGGCAPGPMKTPARSQAPVDRADLERRLERLEAALIDRLALMPDVARYKFANSLPIHDAERETKVTADFVQAAHREGVPGWLAENVINGQLQASRMWQEILIEEWTQTPSDDRTVRDLTTELRPEIDRATARLIECLAESPVNNPRWTAALRLRIEAGTMRPANMPERVWWLAWEPLVGPKRPVSQRRLTVQRKDVPEGLVF